MSSKCEAMHACSFSLVFFLFFFEIKMKKLRIKIQLLLETSLCLTKQWLGLWMADLSTTNFIRSTNMRWFYKLKTRLLLQFQATLSLCKMFQFFHVWWIIIVAQCMCPYSIVQQHQWKAFGVRVSCVQTLADFIFIMIDCKHTARRLACTRMCFESSDIISHILQTKQNALISKSFTENEMNWIYKVRPPAVFQRYRQLPMY